jgi:hypothetical protein
MLRVYDYIADAKGYRIVKTRMVKVGKKQKRKRGKKLDFEEDNEIEIEPVTSSPLKQLTPPPTRHPRLQRRIGQSVVAVQPLFDFTPAEREEDVITAKVPVNVLGRLREPVPVVVRSREPVIRSREPVIRSPEPVIRSREPVIRSREPVIRSREPVIRSREPVVQSRFNAKSRGREGTSLSRVRYDTRRHRQQGRQREQGRRAHGRRVPLKFGQRNGRRLRVVKRRRRPDQGRHLSRLKAATYQE